MVGKGVPGGGRACWTVGDARIPRPGLEMLYLAGDSASHSSTACKTCWKKEGSEAGRQVEEPLLEPNSEMMGTFLKRQWRSRRGVVRLAGT